MSTALASTVHTAAMPAALRSQVRQWYDRMATDNDAIAIAKQHVSSAVEGVRATGEGVTFGAMLGAFHALNPTGLDVKVPGTNHKVPADLLGAVLGLAAGVGATLAPHGIGRSVQNGGVACAVVFGFRQTNDLLVKLREKKTGVTQASNQTISKAAFGGEGGWADGSNKSWAQGSFAGEDPILKVAAGL